MRLITLCLILLFAGFGCSRVTAPTPTTPGALASVPAALTYKIDEKDGESIPLFVDLKNEGGTPLHVTEVRTTCRCALADMWKEGLLKPNESKRLNIKIHRIEHGESQQRLTVLFNNGTTDTQLEIPIRLIGPPLKTPAYGSFRPPEQVELISHGAEVSLQIPLVTFEESQAAQWLRTLKCEHPSLRTTLRLDKEENYTKDVNLRFYSIEITCPPAALAAGPLHTHFVVEHSDGTTNTVAVNVRSENRISVIPALVHLPGHGDLEKSVKILIADRSAEKSKWSLSPVESTVPDWLKLTTSENSPGRFIVTLTRTGDIPEEVIGKEHCVQWETTELAQPLLELRIRVQ